MSRWPCNDYLKGTCNNSFCERWHPPESLFYKNKSGCQFGEKCSPAHRQVDAQPTKWSKSNNDKSAVAMLKKGNWHENVREPVVNHVKGHDRSGRPDEKRDHELKRGRTERRSSNARQLGCVFQDTKPPKSFLRKSSDVQRPIPRVKIHEGYCASHQNSRPKSFARIDLPRCTSSAKPPALQNLRIGLRRRQSDKSKVPAKQRGSWPKVY